MYYGNIKKMAIEDGPGVRVSLYVSGCNIKCKGCHNAVAQDFRFGKFWDQYGMGELLEAIKPQYITGFTVAGGEPLDVLNRDTVAAVIHIVKTLKPSLSIWLYTGYEWEDVKDLDLWKEVDAAVVGPFKLEERDITDENRWRGSRNQRVVDVQASVKANRRILLENIPNNK